MEGLETSLADDGPSRETDGPKNLSDYGNLTKYVASYRRFTLVGLPLLSFRPTSAVQGTSETHGMPWNIFGGRQTEPEDRRPTDLSDYGNFTEYAASYRRFTLVGLPLLSFRPTSAVQGTSETHGMPWNIFGGRRTEPEDRRPTDLSDYGNFTEYAASYRRFTLVGLPLLSFRPTSAVQGTSETHGMPWNIFGGRQTEPEDRRPTDLSDYGNFTEYAASYRRFTLVGLPLLSFRPTSAVQGTSETHGMPWNIFGGRRTEPEDRRPTDLSIRGILPAVYPCGPASVELSLHERRSRYFGNTWNALERLWRTTDRAGRPTADGFINTRHPTRRFTLVGLPLLSFRPTSAVQGTSETHGMPWNIFGGRQTEPEDRRPTDLSDYGNFTEYAASYRRFTLVGLPLLSFRPTSAVQGTSETHGMPWNIFGRRRTEPEDRRPTDLSDYGNFTEYAASYRRFTLVGLPLLSFRPTSAVQGTSETHGMPWNIFGGRRTEPEDRRPTDLSDYGNFTEYAASYRRFTLVGLPLLSFRPTSAVQGTSETHGMPWNIFGGRRTEPEDRRPTDLSDYGNFTEYAASYRRFTLVGLPLLSFRPTSAVQGTSETHGMPWNIFGRRRTEPEDRRPTDLSDYGNFTEYAASYRRFTLVGLPLLSFRPTSAVQGTSETHGMPWNIFGGRRTEPEDRRPTDLSDYGNFTEYAASYRRFTLVGLPLLSFRPTSAVQGTSETHGMPWNIFGGRRTEPEDRRPTDLSDYGNFTEYAASYRRFTLVGLPLLSFRPTSAVQGTSETHGMPWNIFGGRRTEPEDRRPTDLSDYGNFTEYAASYRRFTLVGLPLLSFRPTSAVQGTSETHGMPWNIFGGRRTEPEDRRPTDLSDYGNFTEYAASYRRFTLVGLPLLSFRPTSAVQGTSETHGMPWNIFGGRRTEPEDRRPTDLSDYGNFTEYAASYRRFTLVGLPLLSFRPTSAVQGTSETHGMPWNIFGGRQTEPEDRRPTDLSDYGNFTEYAASYRRFTLVGLPLLSFRPTSAVQGTSETHGMPWNIFGGRRTEPEDRRPTDLSDYGNFTEYAASYRRFTLVGLPLLSFRPTSAVQGTSETHGMPWNIFGGRRTEPEDRRPTDLSDYGNFTEYAASYRRFTLVGLPLLSFRPTSAVQGTSETHGMPWNIFGGRQTEPEDRRPTDLSDYGNFTEYAASYRRFTLVGLPLLSFRPTSAVQGTSETHGMPWNIFGGRRTEPEDRRPTDLSDYGNFTEYAASYRRFTLVGLPLLSFRPTSAVQGTSETHGMPWNIFGGRQTEPEDRRPTDLSIRGILPAVYPCGPASVELSPHERRSRYFGNTWNALEHLWPTTDRAGRPTADGFINTRHPTRRFTLVGLPLLSFRPTSAVQGTSETHGMPWNIFGGRQTEPEDRRPTDLSDYGNFTEYAASYRRFTLVGLPLLSFRPTSAVQGTSETHGMPWNIFGGRQTEPEDRRPTDLSDYGNFTEYAASYRRFTLVGLPLLSFRPTSAVQGTSETHGMPWNIFGRRRTEHEDRRPTDLSDYGNFTEYAASYRRFTLVGLPLLSFRPTRAVQGTSETHGMPWNIFGGRQTEPEDRRLTDLSKRESNTTVTRGTLHRPPQPELKAKAIQRRSSETFRSLHYVPARSSS
ncbi:hypothetical protein MSG28_014267 [Choristoneura fumiferana]|uniref:Uncharacterized protein n=1 Tax=Choristoneura fumiferana TaxID=7141 RepID=A0ACC0JGL4_CHOFU|nr:hypothetical protein MSG28_014267 [Choristoneura fumiferana]